MQANRVKAALKAGESVSGPMINEARSAGTIKMMAEAGHDFFIVDMEHAMFTWETTLNLVQMGLACGICPIVRPTDLVYHLVARAMDTGTLGVMIPRVENREQVERAVSFVKYPPVGRRGAGGDARTGYVPQSAASAIEKANAESMVIVQVESMAGVEAIDEIASVAGVDVVCFGPHDLSINLGMPGTYTEPVFLDAVERVVAACDRHGVAVGMVEKDAATMERWHRMGIRFLVVNSDGNMIMQGARRDVAALRAIIGGETG